MAEGATSVAAFGIGIPNIARSIRGTKNLTVVGDCKSQWVIIKLLVPLLVPNDTKYNIDIKFEVTFKTPSCQPDRQWLVTD